MMARLFRVMRARRLRRQMDEVGWNGWTCHVCGRYRPDERIDVLSRSRMVWGVEAIENIRHCNDKPSCVEGAKSLTFLHGR